MDKMNGTDHWWLEILFGFGNVLVCFLFFEILMYIF